MSCLWCSDEYYAADLIKAIVSNNDQTTLRKLLTDLFLCINCLYMYHRIKEKVLLPIADRKRLLHIELKRTCSHLSKVINIQQSHDATNERSQSLSVDQTKISAMRNPLLEILRYPYLFLNKEIFEKFCHVLEWIIDYVQGCFLDSDVKYPGLFLLLFNHSEKIRNWAIDYLRCASMITNEDFFEFNSVLSCILSREEDNIKEIEVEDCIVATMQLPKYLFSTSTHVTWSAYTVIFSSLQSRTLRVLLSNEKSQHLFNSLICFLKDGDCEFWSVFRACDVLLNKLGSSFWLFMSDIKFASDIFDHVQNNRVFIHFLQHDNNTTTKHSQQFFSWLISLVKATKDLEICFKISLDVVKFIIDVIGGKKKMSWLQKNAEKCFISILQYLTQEFKLHVLSKISVEATQTLIKISKKEKAGRVLLSMLLSEAKKRKIGSNATEETCISKIFEIVQVKKENEAQKEENADVQHQLQLSKELGTADCPIMLDDDMSGDLLQVEDHVSEVEMANTTDSLQKLVESISPIQISDDDTEVGDTNNTMYIDSGVGRVPENASFISSELCTDAINKLKSKLGEKLDEKVLKYHERKQLVGTNLKTKPTTVEPDSLKCKQKPMPLRRERLESELTARLTQHSYSLPDMKSQSRYDSMFFKKCVLRWNPSWLKDGRSELEMDEKLDAVPLDFETYDQYIKTFWPLMLLETWAELQKAWGEREKVTVNYIISDVNENKAYGNIGYLHCEYTEEVRSSSNCYAGCPAEDDIVTLAFNRNGAEVHEFGIVCNILTRPKVIERDGKRVTYLFYHLTTMINYIPFVKDYKCVSVTSVTTLTPVFRRWNALIEFQSSFLAKDILKPFRRRTYELNVDIVARGDKLEKLNPNQLQAASVISQIVLHEQSVIPRIVLLQGPPGTGKSYTLKCTIAHLLQELAKVNGDRTEKHRILVCAASNTAVDEILKRLILSPNLPKQKNSGSNKGIGNCGDFYVLRVGRVQQILPTMRGYSLEAKTKAFIKQKSFYSKKENIQKHLLALLQKLEPLDDELVKLQMSSDASKRKEYLKKLEERTKTQQEHDRYTNLLRKEANCKLDMYTEGKNFRQHQLLRADVIFCTLSGSGSKCMVETFKRYYTSKTTPAFKCVIIDEAGQCSEPDALVPLQYQSSKLILVGDPAQLPATVISQKAFRYNYGQSMFDRIFRALCEKNGGRPAIRLSPQYRMVEEICAFPSAQFYDSDLKTSKIINHPMWNLLKPYSVLNILNSKEERSSSSRSIHNPVERTYAVSICQELLSRLDVSRKHITIITPYRKQVSLLLQDLVTKSLKGINVTTVDDIQGNECEVVILSCVRGDGKNGSIGFLKNPQRMNVALTRAKYCLIVLANCETLKIDADWKDLIEDAVKRNVLYDVNDCSEALMNVFRKQGEDSEASSSEKTRNQISVEELHNNNVRSIHNATQNAISGTDSLGTNIVYKDVAECTRKKIKSATAELALHSGASCGSNKYFDKNLSIADNTTKHVSQSSFLKRQSTTSSLRSQEEDCNSDNPGFRNKRSRLGNPGAIKVNRFPCVSRTSVDHREKKH